MAVHEAAARSSAVGARHVVPLQPRHHQYASAIIEFAGGRRQIRDKSGLAGFAKTRNWKVIESSIVCVKTKRVISRLVQGGGLSPKQFSVLLPFGFDGKARLSAPEVTRIIRSTSDSLLTQCQAAGFHAYSGKN